MVNGKLNTGLISAVLFTIIMMVIVFQLLADTATDLASASNNITAQSSVYPLTNFFKTKGILYLALMAGIVLVFIRALLGGSKK